MEVVNDFLALFAWQTILLTLLRIVLVVGLGLIGLSIAKMLLARLEERLITRQRRRGGDVAETEKRIDTLVRLLRQGVTILIAALVVLVILQDLGVNIGPILASAGIVGLAVGFGAQNLVRDVISGFFIILENQIRVGDVAIVNGTGGLVERINFRTTVLRDLSGVVHVFPNGTITTLANMTHEWSAHVFEVGVAYKEDVDEVMKLVSEVGAEMRGDETFGPLIIEDLEMYGLDQFGDSALIIKGRIKTKPIHQWEVGREFKRRIKRAFDAAGIEIPFPHRTLYFGEASKPFLTRIEEEPDSVAMAERGDTVLSARAPDRSR